jgi:flavin reductase (DIM6/NTAB) family NADH-FMN oxidoreductase RutF
MHKTIEPTILYFGTPVALISTLNPNGSPNLAPMSSAWWLGWSCMLGLGEMGQTSDNLIRTRECVISLPSEDLVTHVDRLALTRGKNPVPEKKRQWAIATSQTNSPSPGSLRPRRNRLRHRVCASVQYKWRVSYRISALSARM